MGSSQSSQSNQQSVIVERDNCIILLKEKGIWTFGGTDITQEQFNELKSMFRKWAVKNHPDRFSGAPKAEYDRVTEAFQNVSNCINIINPMSKPVIMEGSSDDEPDNPFDFIRKQYEYYRQEQEKEKLRHTIPSNITINWLEDNIRDLKKYAYYYRNGSGSDGDGDVYETISKQNYKSTIKTLVDTVFFMSFNQISQINVGFEYDTYIDFVNKLNYASELVNNSASIPKKKPSKYVYKLRKMLEGDLYNNKVIFSGSRVNYFAMLKIPKGTELYLYGKYMYKLKRGTPIIFYNRHNIENQDILSGTVCPLLENNKKKSKKNRFVF